MTKGLVAVTIMTVAGLLAGCARSTPPAAGPGAEKQTSTGPAAAPAVGQDTSLAGCPARQPLLRVGGVFTGEFSPHPMEARFSDTHFTRLHQLPLFGVDPLETKLEPAYGAAE